jgi:hypothetical protein
MSESKALADLTAAEILRLRDHEAALLFPGDEDMVAMRYRKLAMIWHPDRNAGPQAAAVFARIAALHQCATRPRSAAQERRFRTRGGRSFRFAWRSRRETDFGEVLVGRGHIAHVLAPGAHDLAARAGRIAPRFADAGMRAQIEPLLPRTMARLDTADGLVFVEGKRPDQVLLADLVRLGPVDPRHAAWLTTRLLNLVCWLDHAGISHGALGPDTLLVSPERHELALTGPMLCAALFGTAFAALPERTLDLLPRLAADPIADASVDLALVRQTVREALGDPAGTRLAADPALPSAFGQWLLLPPAASAQTDFAGWERARDAAFGPRRFVNWDFDPAAVEAA